MCHRLPPPFAARPPYLCHSHAGVVVEPRAFNADKRPCYSRAKLDCGHPEMSVHPSFCLSIEQTFSSPPPCECSGTRAFVWHSVFLPSTNPLLSDCPSTSNTNTTAIIAKDHPTKPGTPPPLLAGSQSPTWQKLGVFYDRASFALTKCTCFVCCI